MMNATNPAYVIIIYNSDISQRGRDLKGVLKQYLNMVKPSYANYIAPTMAHADIIVPRGGENKVAIALIVQHVHTQLQLVRKIGYAVDVAHLLTIFFLPARL